jgi:argininosuccinate synthase
MSAPKKVVLAYSGGLDTSIILKWLQTEYGCEVVTFTADLGQGEELEPARKKAEMLGVTEIYIEDLREEFVRDFVFPMFRANALYEGLYLLGTSIARPLISKRLVEIAAETGADAVSHGATGKGNDQVRFELSAYALNPDIKVIAPWRLWDLTSRTKLLDFAEQNQIPIAKDKRGEAPFSVDANLLHTSSEGKVLENPADEAPDYVYQRTVHPEDAPDAPEMVEITFEKGDAVAIDGVAMSPATILTRLNELGGKHGVGRLDLVENRFVGMKSRGIYETPGGTILLGGASRDRADHARFRRGAPQGLDHAALRGADLQRVLVLARARDAAGPDRQIAGACHRHRPREALQGLRPHRRPLVRPLALFRGACDLRGGRRRLRPEGRAGLHPAERAAAEAARGKEAAGEVYCTQEVR